MMKGKNAMKKKLSIITRIGTAALLVIALSLALMACGGQASQSASSASQSTASSEPAVQLQIFAANSLEKALPEVQALYTAAHPNVTFADSQFKGSGDLVTQIQGGATPDLLITASKGSMDTAATGGYIDDATRKDMFTNDLVIARAVGSNINIASLNDVTSDTITKIAIGDADAVPAGQYANQSLNSIGLYSEATGKGGSYADSIAAKVSVASSVGNAAKYVETGDCQIGFVYSSDLYRYSGIESAFVVPAGSHTTILYPGAVLKQSKNATVAADFLNFCMTDAEAQKIWSKYGFQVK